MEFIYRLQDIDIVAEDILKQVDGHSVLTFSGELGAGKTTLVHALCRRLGVKGSLSSPTFAIINEYEGEMGDIYHIDLYRCRDEEEAIRAGVEDCLYSGRLCLVEWPSKAPGLFTGSVLRLVLTEIDNNTRKVSTGGDPTVGV